MQPGRRGTGRGHGAIEAAAGSGEHEIEIAGPGRCVVCDRERDILNRRRELYQLARRANPTRWSLSTRNWNPIGLVVVNPQEGAADAAN